MASKSLFKCSLLLFVFSICATAARSVDVLYPNEYIVFYKYDTVMIKYETQNNQKFEVECKLVDFNVMGAQYNNYLRIGMTDPINHVCKKAGSIRPDNPHYFNYPWIINDYCNNTETGDDWCGPTNWLNVDLDSALIHMSDYESNDFHYSPSYFGVRWTPRPGGPMKFGIDINTVATKKEPAKVNNIRKTHNASLKVSLIRGGVLQGFGDAIYISNSKGKTYLPSGRILRNLAK